jgi:hypothetical protein
MAVDFNNFLSYINTGLVGKTQAPAQVAPAKSFKNASYAAIKYEKMPTVTDTVPTKDASGKPLLAGYVTPEKVWVA